MAHPRALVSLVLVMCFCDAEAANLVLQRRTFQSEPFGGSALACDASRCGSQSVDDYEDSACRHGEGIPIATPISFLGRFPAFQKCAGSASIFESHPFISLSSSGVI